jgi:heat shock protein HslJ
MGSYLAFGINQQVQTYMKKHIACSCILSLLLLASCYKPSDEAVDRQAETAPPQAPGSIPVTPFDAATGRYTGFEDIPDLVQLQQGKWEGAPWDEGSATRPQIILLEGVEAVGDLNGDGEVENAILLNLAMGGTGQLLYLAAVPSGADSNTVIQVSLVGDRVRVREINIRDGKLLLDVLQAGPEDAMCCPGELATRAWELDESGVLMEIESGIESQRLSVATLLGSEWVLDRWSRDELAGNSEISLAFVDNGIAGSSGCNRYNASTVDGEAPGEVSIGPAAVTRMACPEAQMAVESRFLQALSKVNKMGFLKRQLLLTSASEAGITSMYFDPRGED